MAPDRGADELSCERTAGLLGGPLRPVLSRYLSELGEACPPPAADFDGVSALRISRTVRERGN